MYFPEMSCMKYMVEECLPPSREVYTPLLLNINAKPHNNSQLLSIASVWDL